MRHSLKLYHKLALVFFAFAMAVTGVTGLILHQAAKARVLQDIRQRLHDIVAVVPQAIDAQAHDRLQSPSQEGSADYMEIKRTLQRIRDASSDIHFIYTMRQGPGGDIVFVVDAESKEEDIAHLGEVYDDPSELLARSFADLSGPLVEEDFYTDEWGTWLSGYAPFHRRDGTRAGVVGVDISAGTVMAYRRQVLMVGITVFVLSLPLTLAAGYLLSRRLVKPVLAVKEGAERIGRGDLETRLEVDRGDELGMTAAALNDMAAKIKANRDLLTEMAAKYRSIFDNAAEGIFQTTPTGRIITANTALCRLLGYDSFEDLSATVKNIRSQVYADPEDRDVLMAMVRAKGNARNFQTRFRRKDGLVMRVEMQIHALRGDDGELILEGMVQDIGERLKREEAERRRAEAEASSQAKSQFLANMSHEIRTPMNGIMGMLQLMQGTSLDQEQQEYARLALQSTKRLTLLLSDILDLSKVEAGELAIRSVAFDLPDAMRQVRDMFLPAAKQTGVELILDIDPAVPDRIMGDSLRLQQVLTNLVGNALKFTGSGAVTMSAVPLDTPDTARAWVLFTVSDTGDGIPEDRLESIFRPFEQGEEAYRRSAEGAGLGLAISKRLVDLMGGHMTVESEVGKGSAFHFRIPFPPAP